MGEKRIVSDEVSIQIAGKEFVGQRTIEGARKLFQTIHYGGDSRYDGHPYKPGEKTVMNSVARIILRELVQEAGHHPEKNIAKPNQSSE